jgi:hypothetical protein
MLIGQAFLAAFAVKVNCATAILFSFTESCCIESGLGRKAPRSRLIRLTVWGSIFKESSDSLPSDQTKSVSIPDHPLPST